MVREIVILALACLAMMATPSAALPRGNASALLRRSCSRAWVWETGGEMNRLRGGGFFTVSKPVWPILDKDEIPQCGSEGGHYTMAEVISGSKIGGIYIGEVTGLSIFVNVLTWIIGTCALVIWLNTQAWVPPVM